MKSIIFKSTMPSLAVITRFTTAALLLVALAACNSGGGGSGGGSTKKAKSIPELTNLITIEVNQGVNLSWGKVTGATKYTVYYHTASFKKTTDSGVQSKTDITTTNTSIIDLTNDITYYLQVAAINKAGKLLAISKIVEVTPKASVPTKLQPPTKVVATGGDETVNISWKAVTGATKYTVYYHTASFDKTTDSVVQSKTVDAPTTNARIADLTNGTTYFFRVIASNASSSSALSQIKPATPKATATTNLEAPTGLQATGGDKIVDISWKAVTGATKYTVYYHTASFDKTTDSVVQSKTVDAPTTNTRITGLTNGTPYFFRVIASNASSSSALSQIKQATPKASATTNLKPPTGLQATGGDKIVDISWDKVDGATSYTVYYRKDKSFDSTTPLSLVDSTTDITTTNIRITGLIGGTKYYLRVEAINADGDKKLSTEIATATTNLKPPTGLQATGGDELVDISWGKVTGATKYTVYYHTDNSFDSSTSGVQNQPDITTDNIRITGLTAGTKYYLRVEAINADGDKKLSTEIATATTILVAPTELKATGKDKAIDLTWDAVDGATSYKVYYSKVRFSSTTDSRVKSTDITTDTSISITDLSVDTTYYFRVIASNPIVSSALSKTQSTNTKAKLNTNLKPPIIKEVTARLGAIDLTWDASGDAASYKVYYRDASFDSTTVSRIQSKTKGITKTTRTTRIDGLDNGKEYFISIAAIGATGDSSVLSNQVSAITILPAPTSLQATGMDKAIGLTWSAVTGATSYTVYYHTKSFDSTADIDSSTTIRVQSKTVIAATSTSITGLDNGKEYFFRVIASNAKVSSVLSREAKATTKLPAPNITAVKARLDAIDLTWDAVTGATSYSVYYRSTTGSGDSVIKFRTSTTTSTSITSLENGTEYFISLVASNLKLNAHSVRSGEVSVITKLPAPTNVIATARPGAIGLTWDAVTGATKYTVYYSKASIDNTSDSRVQSQTGITANNTSITGLSDSTTYYFRVIAINPIASSALSQTQSATTNLPAPNITAVKAGLDAIDLTWDAVAGADSYKVYYSKASFDNTSDSRVQSQTGIKTTNTSITGLDNGTEYFIRLVATNSGGDSALSTKEIAITKLPAPTGLKATGKNKAIDLTWNAVTGATSYKVYYSKVSFSDIAGLSPKTVQSPALSTSIIIGLLDGKEYFIRLVASNIKGDSELSGEVKVITELPAPTGLQATGKENAIDLTWDAVTGDKIKYTVYYHTAEFDSTSDSTVDSTTDITTTSISITGLSAGKTYYFRVIASNPIVSSALSEIQSTSTKAKPNPKLSAPTELKATGGDKTLAISWKAVKDATSYKVYYSTASFSGITEDGVKDKTTDATSTDITGLSAGTKYFIRLAASNTKGDSAPSAVASATTNLPAPTKVVATARPGAIDLRWDKVDKATTYTVYYSDLSFDSTTDSNSGVISINIHGTAASISSGLTAGTTYYFRVVASNSNISSELSQIQSAIAEAPATANLAAPTSFKAAVGKNETIDLSWDVVDKANSYKVYYSDASFDSTTEDGVQFTRSVTTTKISISSGLSSVLSAGTKYYFAVAAIANGATGTLSQIKSVTTRLAKPTQLSVRGKNKAIDLSWKAVAGATEYTVYYRTGSFDNTYDSGVQSKTNIPAPATGTTVKASIAGLSASTTYYLRVKAIGAESESNLSREATATTKASVTAPTNLKATGKDKAIDIRWDAVTGVTGVSYRVYYSKASFAKDKTSDPSVTVTQATTTDTNTSITGLSSGTRYYLRVEAINADGDTNLSDQAEAITILVAPTVKATGKDNAIDLSWDAVDGATSYTVYYSDASFDSTTLNGVDSTTDITTKFSLTGLPDGATYYLRVIAVNPDISSALSEIKSATTRGTAPTNLKATGKDKAIDISWDAVTGVTGVSYRVYYSKASFAKDETSDPSVTVTKATTATNASITGLSSGTRYYLRVAAINANGDTSLSEQKIAITILVSPSIVKATGKDNAIDLSWDAIDGAASYTVYYHTANNFDSTTVGVKDKTTDATIFSLTGLPAGATYYFGVIASNAITNSVLSQIVSATAKRAAPQASASISRLAAVDLSWNSLNDVKEYKIYYAKHSLGNQGVNINVNLGGIRGGGSDTTTGTSITIGDLSADTRYHFVVVANYDNGEKGAADEVSADSSYIAELAMGGVYGCVRLNTGSIKCWGKNDQGQLGVGSTGREKTTATSVSNFRAKQLSTGDNHSCAIDLDDMLYCWGYNNNLQLGLDGGNRNRPEQVTQANLDKVSVVTAGVQSTCAQAGNENYCWGSQYLGVLGNGVNSGDTTMDAQPINNIRSNVKQFALGDYSGCAIDATKDLWCWGNNYDGQVGNGKNGMYERETSPVNPKLKGKDDNHATKLGGKYYHYCVVDNAKKIQCWGFNGKRQLGIGSTANNSNSPQYVITSTDPTSDSTPDHHLSDASKVATGRWHSCALIEGGKVRCWGSSDNGIIGTNGGGHRSIADTDMQDINNAIDIAAGHSFTCVLLNDKKSVKCWGKNDTGQLGRGTTGGSSATPMEVDGLKDIYQ